MEKLGDIAKQLVFASDSRCENCGYWLKHKTASGQRKWCERCIKVYNRRESLTPEKAEELIMNLVEPLYFDATLDNLDSDVREKLLSLENGQDVFMFGSVGVGKTYTMAALIKRYICLGFECRRMNFDDFCIEIRSTYAPAAKRTEQEVVDVLKNVDKLFIDDLGMRSEESEFAFRTLYSLINKRQERLLPTFVSSNKNIERLEQSFDSRIASRLQTALIIELKGKDRRKVEEK